mmetsp:Transcript_9103/g.15821  ORF Transcript_9103/g.15821 Transcript_9103/m.15821 type:complete len:239 (-) Transcript_9103:727-1443(-)
MHLCRGSSLDKERSRTPLGHDLLFARRTNQLPFVPLQKISPPLGIQHNLGTVAVMIQPLAFQQSIGQIQPLRPRDTNPLTQPTVDRCDQRFVNGIVRTFRTKSLYKVRFAIDPPAYRGLGNIKFGDSQIFLGLLDDPIQRAIRQLFRMGLLFANVPRRDLINEDLPSPLVLAGKLADLDLVWRVALEFRILFREPRLTSRLEAAELDLGSPYSSLTPSIMASIVPGGNFPPLASLVRE